MFASYMEHWNNAMQLVDEQSIPVSAFIHFITFVLGILPPYLLPSDVSETNIAKTLTLTLFPNVIRFCYDRYIEWSASQATKIPLLNLFLLLFKRLEWIFANVTPAIKSTVESEVRKVYPIEPMTFVCEILEPFAETASPSSDAILAIILVLTRKYVAHFASAFSGYNFLLLFSNLVKKYTPSPMSMLSIISIAADSGVSFKMITESGMQLSNVILM